MGEEIMGARSDPFPAGGAGWVLGIRAAGRQPDSLPRPHHCPGTTGLQPEVDSFADNACVEVFTQMVLQVTLSKKKGGH